MSEPIRLCQVIGDFVGGGVEHVVLNYYKYVDRSRVQFDFIDTQNSVVFPCKDIESLGGRLHMFLPYKNLPAGGARLQMEPNLFLEAALRRWAAGEALLRRWGK